MRRLLTAGIGTAALVLGVAAPAVASDKTLTGDSAYDDGKYRGIWEDAYDNLCARSLGPDPALVKIEPADGSGPSFQIKDPSGGGRTCTGNLSIPEDEMYWMTVYHDRRPQPLHQVAYGNFWT
jgi:hypothetical protein